MKKKILITGILIVLMLVTISYATALNTTNTENKESPLYRLRISMAIREKVENIIENIRTKFLGERIFFLPSKQSRKGLLSVRDSEKQIIKEYTEGFIGPTCAYYPTCSRGYETACDYQTCGDNPTCMRYRTCYDCGN